MALNTGGFTLGVMPTAPTGVEKLGAFNVGQVLEASRLGAENVEQAFNTPFRVQQEIAKTQTAKAQSDIDKAKAANAPALLEAQLADQRESVKSNILANKLSSNTLEAKTKLTKTKADLAQAELAFTNETNPIKKQVLQANLDSLRAKADTDKAEYDAALSADLFAAQAGVKAGMARAGTKALAGFSEDGTREVAPGVIQTLVPTADGASVATITTPSAKILAAKPQTVPVYMGTDDKGNAVVQNYTVDPSTGEPRSAIGAKLTVRDLPAGVIGAEYYKAPTKVSQLQKALDTSMIKSLETLPIDVANYENSKVQITKALDELKESWGATSGPVAGAIPDKYVRSRADAMNAVKTAIQTQLRAIYGSQFTRDEGERFFKTAFDSYASEKENIDRLIKLQAALDRAINAKMEMSAWIEAGHDTFQGFPSSKLIPQGAVTAETVAANLSSLSTPDTKQSYDAAVTATGTPGPIGDTQAAAAPAVTPAKKTSGRFTIEAIE